MNSNKKGFTLIEMIFYFTIILVVLLFGILDVKNRNHLV